MNKHHVGKNVLAGILLSLVLVAGCAMEPERVTKENYDKLDWFMTFESVVDILGEPDVESTRMGVRQYTWVEGNRHIHAKFIANRAVYYSSKGLEPVEGAAPKPAAGH